MNLTKFVILLNLVFLVSGSFFYSSNTYYIGNCPYVRPKETFSKYLMNGTWYEQQRYYQRTEPQDSCGISQYTISATTGNIDISNTNRNNWRGGYRAERYSFGTAYNESPDNTTSRFLANYPSERNRWEYWYVLDTDYKEFAIIWTCSQVFIWYNPQCRILTRQKSGSSNTLINCRHTAYDRGASIYYLRDTGRNC